jgi:hypothetical protein
MLLRRLLRFRYSLRALLVFITLFALWGGYHANRSFKDRRAELILLRHRARLEFWEIQPYWPERLISAVEVDSSLEPEVIDALAGLVCPRSIAIGAPSPPEVAYGYSRPQQVAAPTGAIDRILKRHKLHSFAVTDFILSGAAFAAIAKHRSLEELAFTRTNLSDGELSALVVLPRLRHLSFQSCPASGSLLADVPGSKTLESIECQGSPVGIEFARFVARSPTIRALSVGFEQNPQADDFVSALGAHPSLAELRLGSGELTDASIPALERMQMLRELQSFEHLTVQGRACLSTKRPRLEIH